MKYWLIVIGMMLKANMVLANDPVKKLEQQLITSVSRAVEYQYGFPLCQDIFDIGNDFLNKKDRNKKIISIKKLAGYDQKKVRLTMQWYIPLWRFIDSYQKNHRDLYEWTGKCEDTIHQKYTLEEIKINKKINDEIKNKTLVKKVAIQYGYYLKSEKK